MFGVVQVLSDQYPLELDIIYPGHNVTLHVDISSDEPVRLKTYLVDEVEVLIYGYGVTVIYLASTMEELP